MRLVKIIIGEIVLILASVLIFRSLWTLLDQYLGYSHLILLLVIGMILAIISLVWINNEIKSK
jgi:membrane protein DedA with SNARE-associated domain